MNFEHNPEEKKIDQGWEKSRQNEVIERLLKGEDLQTILESLPGFKEAFTELDTIDCSDGRVLQGKKIGIAGSGVLLFPEELVKFIANYKGKIKTVTTHRNCGAAGMKFTTLKSEEIPAGVETADEYGTYCGEVLAKELGAEHNFLDMEQMANEYHNETAIVLDQTGEFDSTNLEKFPAHFVCSGAGLGFSPEYMKKEVKALADIALGHHGFGHRFDANNPFYIIVAAENQEELARWQDIAREAVAGFGDKVAIKGFVAPEK